MSRDDPKRWSQLGASLVVTLIENDAVDSSLPPEAQRSEEITTSLRALFHLAHRFGLDPWTLTAEAMRRYADDLTAEEA